MNIRLRHLPRAYAVCRLGPDDAIPEWAGGELLSFTRTPNELSIVCAEECVPPAARAERGWRCLVVEGPIPFEVTGVAAAIASPLAKAGISVFLLSTFDTDYLLVKDASLPTAVSVLRNAGLAVD